MSDQKRVGNEAPYRHPQQDVSCRSEHWNCGQFWSLRQRNPITSRWLLENQSRAEFGISSAHMFCDACFFDYDVGALRRSRRRHRESDGDAITDQDNQMPEVHASSPHPLATDSLKHPCCLLYIASFGITSLHSDQTAHLPEE